VTHPPPLIAVVDDEAAVRTMLCRVLRLADYEVAAFGSAEELLASLMSRTPACAVVDIHMPGMSGLDLPPLLRVAGRRVPVVLITASDDAMLDRTAVAAGAVSLLRKPFTTDVLLAAVQQALACVRSGVAK